MNDEDKKRLLDALIAIEARLTQCGRAFYGSGKSADLKAAFNGWTKDIELAREAIRRANGGVV